jgi:hypothetical protein
LLFFEWLRSSGTAAREELCFLSQDFAHERFWYLGNSHIIVHIGGPGLLSQLQ